jgi:outer membrane protein assembly factor BamB
MQLGPPAADGGIVFSATGLGSLAALDAVSGEVLWLSGYPQFKSESLENGNSAIDKFLPRMLRILARGASSPIVTEDVVVLAPRDAPGLIAFDRQTGQVRWLQELNDARFIAGICNGNLLVADNRIQALSLATGKVEWEYELQGKTKTLVGRPGYSGAMLYLPSPDGLELVDARTGKFIVSYPWDAKTGALSNFTLAGSSLIGVNSKWVGVMVPNGSAANH